jgi:cellulose synthase/poly-beta-1,6-N-acetylglucosamine synthase-like glycosyltransferase
LTIPEFYTIIITISLFLYGVVILFFTGCLLNLSKRSKSNQPEISTGIGTAFGVQFNKFIGSRHVTIIIPTRNEECNIMRTLEELAIQDYPVEFLQVIVTDDFSEDNTIALAEGFSQDHPVLQIIVLDAKKSEKKGNGKKHAIERAIEVATGEIILCTDADTWRCNRWITFMVNGFENPEICMCLGPVFFKNKMNFLQTMQDLEFLGIMGVTAGSAAAGYPLMCNGANLAFRRNAFVEVGGYSGNFQYVSGDDQFLLGSVIRLYGRGSVSFILDQNAIIYTEAESTFQGFLSQRIRWISKSPGYRDPAVIAMGFLTWFTVVWLFSGILVGLVYSPMLVPALILLIIKMAIDFPIVWTMIKFSEKKGKMRYFFLAQIFQSIYLPAISFLGLLLPYKWKGRRI